MHYNMQKPQAFKLFHSTIASMSLHILGLPNYFEYKNQMFNYLLKIYYKLINHIKFNFFQKI